MLNVLVKFIAVFVPTCAIGICGLWLALTHDSLWCLVGWAIAILFGIVAAFELFILTSGLVRINRALVSGEQKLQELEKRDAELFAQGKSFDEVISQYKKPKS